MSFTIPSEYVAQYNLDGSKEFVMLVLVHGNGFLEFITEERAAELLMQNSPRCPNKTAAKQALGSIYGEEGNTARIPVGVRTLTFVPVPKGTGQTAQKEQGDNFAAKLQGVHKAISELREVQQDIVRSEVESCGNNETWKKLAATGNLTDKIEAIKLVRDSRKTKLIEAKQIVEDYQRLIGIREQLK